MSEMRWRCGDLGCFLQRRTDPVMFDRCFPPGVAMGDLDGIVELGGQFLVVEFKRTGVVPVGQRRMHQALIATGVFTIIIVTAVEQHVSGCTVYSPKHPEGRNYPWCSSDDLVDLVQRWSRKVDPGRTPAGIPQVSRPAS